MSREAPTSPPLRVELAERSYDIHLGRGVLDAASEILGPILSLPRVVVVTDERLAATAHPGRLEASLARAGVATRRVVVPAGEATKSMGRLEALLDDLLAHGAERRLTIVALGGGVVGDLAGFAAAVLLRGVDYVQVPTTLLAQVDSAVGGKTGVNSRHGKNLIGSFHQPRAVLIDTDTLATLPERELKAGYAEVVKYGLIRDGEFFEWLEANGRAVLGGDPAAQATAIRRSLAVKAAIVAADERETGTERALLNFGHTFAHAYEALAGYGAKLLHGEAVSLGMVKALRLSRLLGHCPGQDTERAVRHLVSLGMPTRLSDLPGLPPFPADDLLAAMGRDKKVENARLRFVLARGIGDTFVSAHVPEGAVREVLATDDG
ncbi:MAG TPA: 3-dehydroquinate synthase [Geminicoccaceae bacterium]